jgi:hypothetical protein
MHRTDVLPDRLKSRNIYSRLIVAKLVRDGVLGHGNAWRRWPRPQTGRPDLVVVIGRRP